MSRQNLKYQPWVNVAVFEDFDTAQSLDRILSRNGFEGRVHFDKLLQTFLFLCPPRATYRVQVHRDDFKGAVQFMDTQPEAAPVLEEAIHCPSCSSLRINYPQMTRKFFLPTLLLHLGVIFRVIDHEAYCEQCHHTWNLPKPEAARITKTRPAH